MSFYSLVVEFLDAPFKIINIDIKNIKNINIKNTKGIKRVKMLNL